MHAPPSPPESRFLIKGINFWWPLDPRRREGPWSERHMPDVCGQRPAWLRRIMG